MRFMILLKADKITEAGVLPDEKLLTEMGKYNEELVNAGVLHAGEGLQPSSKAVRIKFSGTDRRVTEGPFDLKELVCGFWIFKVNSREKAIELQQNMERFPDFHDARILTETSNPKGTTGDAITFEISKSKIWIRSGFVSEWKTIRSSRRLRNSGRNVFFASSMIFSRIAS